MDKKENLIIQKITGLSKSQLFLNTKIDSKDQIEIDKAIKRLKNGEPIEYIINSSQFYSLNFYVNTDVLIPRDDTEIMVDKAIETIVNIPKELDKRENITLIDVGTGSSCIAISILKNTFKINNSYVVDISESALKISNKNIISHKLDKKIYQIHGDLLKDFLLNKEYELSKNIVITANLPYIKNNDFDNIDKETIKFEPALALYGGKNTGFELYEKLINQVINLKKINKEKNIYLFIEIGFDQKEYSTKYLNNLNLKFEIFKDNGGVDRCIKIKF